MLITISTMINPLARFLQLRFRLIPGWKYAPRSGSHHVGQGCFRSACKILAKCDMGNAATCYKAVIQERSKN
jgi:hypothetical protein